MALNLREIIFDEVCHLISVPKFRITHAPIVQDSDVPTNSAGEDITSLMQAVCTDSDLTAKRLLDKSEICKNINARNSHGQTVLMLACKYHKTELVCALLKLDNIDINARDAFGMTPFLYACKNRCFKIAAILINIRVNVFAIDDNYCDAIIHLFLNQFCSILNGYNFNLKSITLCIRSIQNSPTEIIHSESLQKCVDLFLSDGRIDILNLLAMSLLFADEMLVSDILENIETCFAELDNDTYTFLVFCAIYNPNINILLLFLNRTSMQFSGLTPYNVERLLVLTLFLGKTKLLKVFVEKFNAILIPEPFQTLLNYKEQCELVNTNYADTFSKSDAETVYINRDSSGSAEESCDTGFYQVNEEADVSFRSSSTSEAHESPNSSSFNTGFLPNTELAYHDSTLTSGVNSDLTEIDTGLNSVKHSTILDEEYGTKDSNGNDVFLLSCVLCDSNFVSYLIRKQTFYLYSVNTYCLTALMLSCGNTYDDVLITLIKSRLFNLSLTDHKGRNLFIYLCYYDLLSVITSVEIDDLDINAEDINGMTGTLIAAERGSDGIVSHLLHSKGIDINCADNLGETMLMKACINGRRKIVSVLLEQPHLDINRVDIEGRTALTLATMYGYTSIVSMLQEHSDINVNVADDSGRTALMWACILNLSTIASALLLNAEVDVNCRDIDGFTALTWSVVLNHVDIVSTLLWHNNIDANLSDIDGVSPLMWAAWVTPTLMQPIIDWLKRFSFFSSVVKIANVKTRCYKTERTSAVRKLLELPLVDINAVDDDGETALMKACAYGKSSTVNYLLTRRDIDVNVTDSEGNSSLIIAASEQHTPIVAMLLNHGVVINTSNNLGKTALSIAKERKFLDIVKLLKKAPSSLCKQS